MLSRMLDRLFGPLRDEHAAPALHLLSEAATGGVPLPDLVRKIEDAAEAGASWLDLVKATTDGDVSRWNEMVREARRLGLAPAAN